MIDTAFFDRFHAYIPGWEIPKMRPEFFTNSYGLITDYLAEYMREMRKRSFADAIDRYFKLGNNLNQRDVIAVRRTVSGLLKLLHPDGKYEKDDVRACLKYALETRRRVKEQLKKLGGMEFFDVHFSFIDNESLEEIFVNVPEQGGSSLIPEGMPAPGVVYQVTQGSSGQMGLYRFETQMTAGTGKFTVSGLGSNTAAKEAIRVGFDFLKGNLKRISASTKLSEHEYNLHVIELHNTGPSTRTSLAALVAFCSVLMSKPFQEQMVVLGDMTLGGVVNPVQDLAGSLQLALDSGARRVLLPMSSAADIPSVPAELFSKFQISFYADPVDAVFKALGVS